MPLFARLPEPLRARLTRRRQENDPRELALSLRHMGTGAQPSLWNALPRLAVPTLALAGSEDAKFARIAEAMSASGRVRKCVVPHTAHAPHLERPAHYARIVSAWMRRCEAAHG
jgi:pimeloyl-ACP methyl ester carboxylesterase